MLTSRRSRRYARERFCLYFAHACLSSNARARLQVEGEAELLLPAGIALKITGVLPKDASGLTIITCEDDDDAPALIS